MNIINKFLFRLRLKKINNSNFFMEELLYYQSRCEVLERQNKDLIVRIIDIQKELKELKGQNRLLVGTIKENETIHKSS